MAWFNKSLSLKTARREVDSAITAIQGERPSGLDPAIWSRLTNLLRSNLNEITTDVPTRFVGEVRWGWEWVRWDARREMGDASSRYYDHFFDAVSRGLARLEQINAAPMRESFFEPLKLPLSKEMEGLKVRAESLTIDSRGFGPEDYEGPMLAGDNRAIVALAAWFGDLSLLPAGSEVELFDWRLRVSRNYLPPLPDESADVRTYTPEIWHRFSRMLYDVPSGHESNPLGLRDVFHLYRTPPRNLLVYMDAVMKTESETEPETKILISGSAQNVVEMLKAMALEHAAKPSKRTEELQVLIDQEKRQSPSSTAADDS